MSDKGGVWRTVSGRRIFIKDGQSLTDAMKESGKFKKSRKTTVRLGKQEYAVVMHELNTYYSTFENKAVYGKSIGEYFYMFDNYGYDSYYIFRKIPIVGNENFIREIQKELKNGQSD